VGRLGSIQLAALIEKLIVRIQRGEKGGLTCWNTTNTPDLDYHSKRENNKKTVGGEDLLLHSRDLWVGKSFWGKKIKMRRPSNNFVIIRTSRPKRQPPIGPRGNQKLKSIREGERGREEIREKLDPGGVFKKRAGPIGNRARKEGGARSAVFWKAPRKGTSAED